MIDWKEKLNAFLLDFEYTDDVTGILVCGSFITGDPSIHSDLDVHMILDDRVNYRERGNRLIDGLLIEYFANPPRQILKYFDDDVRDKSLMSLVQFATGQIMLDKNGAVKSLKEKAKAMIDSFYNDERSEVSESTKYYFWDMLDDLQDAYGKKKPDFDFLYFNLLNNLLSNYMGCINRPYTFKAIFGNITDHKIREKYLLKELPDTSISDLIAKCITASGQDEKMCLFKKLTDEIINKSGGFDVDKYKLKTDVE